MNSSKAERLQLLPRGSRSDGLDSDMPGATFAYGVFFWQGVGSLFPWNAFINSSYYFHHRFCGTPYADNFESYFTTPFTVCQTLALWLLLRFGGAFELKDLIMYPLKTFTVVFLIMSVFVVLRANVSLLFWFSIVLTCLTGAMGAIMQGGIFGLVAKFPPVYTGALMNGQALAGLLASAVGFLTSVVRSIPNLCAGPDASEVVECQVFHDDYSTLFFFLLTSLVMITGILSLNRLLTMPIAEMYISELPSSTGSLEGLGGDAKYQKAPSLAASPRPTRNKPRTPSVKGAGAEFVHELQPQPEQPPPRAEPSTCYDTELMPLPLDQAVDIEADSGGHFQALETRQKRPVSGMRRGLTQDDLLEHVSAPSSLTMVIDTLYNLASPACAVFLNFAITIAMFPGIAVHLVSERECTSSSRIFNDLFVPLLLILFNAGDLIGRAIAGSFSPGWLSAKNIWIVSVARVIFVPIFLTSNVRNNALPVLFPSDLETITTMVLLGATNGFVASKAMMLGPTLVKKDQAPVAGTIMVCVLTLGLLSGSLLSFPAQQIVAR